MSNFWMEMAKMKNSNVRSHCDTNKGNILILRNFIP